ncbi:MAG: FKBP-type peptidyl-prolyl cis-trans isomerase [Gammaproteobacteria bacterium]|nr:FKBP-type peptidyl-prolyl cis-trans isomerase [Gammaproteobacteria bacterium]NIR85535.1 FKBP-type peptidyl-prolyl cis-trans isomerase [Gammaproteobacteria bacterium]NIR89794.1 FKBP-type peptidyl-prolyl cis-trans isomerase [Gammaproteobacteria bacterium]NIU06670.1 FKBP-type peptidyl-prolyl cis-trans isomerase [Gammaproteobacteria bacterium]NIV75061.1 hypothetical protein [Gammaproteobacteria bacterium]
MNTRFLPLLVVFALPLGAYAQEEPEISTNQQIFSYALGLQYGQRISTQLENQGVEIDAAAMAAGIQDAVGGEEYRIPLDELQAAVKQYQQDLQTKQQAAAEQNLKSGQEFLAENKAKEEVVTLPSGLQYKVLEAGSGKSPSAEDSVVVHYRGQLLDGTEFDSSYSRGEPTTLQIGETIEGWQEALPLMQEGAKWRLFVPPELAYGERGAGGAIGPNETLIFDVELITVN